MSLLTIDDRTREALSRLTENEKLCLRRRLAPQTAKEMAIELGISPHAVEKRLKMARAKLGVSSSLTAARLLAGLEADQPTVPQSPDLSFASPQPQQTGAVTRFTGKRARRLLIGGSSMIAALCMLALVPHDAPASFVPSPSQKVQHLDQMKTRKVDMKEAAIFLAEGFRLKDLDHNGFLDPREISSEEPRDAADRDPTLPPAPPVGTPDLAAERKWMAKMDTDRDGKVSQNEYIAYMIPWILWQGVPDFWHPKG